MDTLFDLEVGRFNGSSIPGYDARRIVITVGKLHEAMVKVNEYEDSFISVVPTDYKGWYTQASRVSDGFLVEIIHYDEDEDREPEIRVLVNPAERAFTLEEAHDIMYNFCKTGEMPDIPYEVLFS